MNKKIIVTVLLLFSALLGYSQVSWNVKAGMNVSTQTLYGVDCLKPGYQFGVGMDYYFTDNWGIQPSVMLISKGYKSNHHVLYQDIPQTFAYDYYITVNRIYAEMPVMLAYRINLSNTMKLVLNGGGYISYGIGGKRHDKFNVDGSIFESTSNTFSSYPWVLISYKPPRFDTGLVAGVTFEFKNKYTIGLIGELGLKEVDGLSKNQTYGINVGYKFQAR